jgi:hypothetical protein
MNCPMSWNKAPVMVVFGEPGGVSEISMARGGRGTVVSGEVGALE